MKVLIIGPFPKPVNGCSIANEVLLQQLNLNSSISLSVINTNSKNISSENVGSFSLTKVFSFFKNYKNMTVIKEADIVYTTPGQTFYGIIKYLPFYFYCRRFKKPYLIHVHGNHLGNEYKSLKGIKKRIFAYYIKRAAAGIVLSKSLKNNFEDLVDMQKVHIVENFAQNNLTQNNKIEKPKDKLRLLYLSNLMEEKGILDFLDSLILLKNAGILFAADVAGKIEDESELLINTRLEELKDSVSYHGVVFGEEKVKLLKESNVFILPTYYRMEGQPISLIEAMAAGNIVVTTKFSGIPDIVSEENGYYVEAKNPKTIFNTLLTINKNLAQEINKFSKTNIEYVKSSFTESQFAEKINSIIKKVVSNN